MNSKIFVAAALATVMTTGCMEDDPNRRAKIGAVTGAAVGAVIGNNVGGGGGTNRAIGAAIGALAGGGVGYYMDRQASELRSALEGELAADYAMVERIDKDTIKVSLSSEASFAVGSATLKSAMKPALNRIASVMSNYDKTAVHVVGHTDSTGSAESNQVLSERRASSVAGYLRGQGVSDNRLYTEGYGESEPRASNDSEDGRRMNRRVEMFINAVVEGNESNATRSPY